MNGRQGWLYISENYLGFYSALLGVERKQLVELKNIKDISKENSKRNMFADSLRIITKDEEEVIIGETFVIKHSIMNINKLFFLIIETFI